MNWWPRPWRPRRRKASSERSRVMVGDDEQGVAAVLCRVTWSGAGGAAIKLPVFRRETHLGTQRHLTTGVDAAFVRRLPGSRLVN